MTDEREQPRVLPTGDYEDYRRRVHYSTELMWVLGAGHQVLAALRAVMAEHNANVKNAADAAESR